MKKKRKYYQYYQKKRQEKRNQEHTKQRKGLTQQDRKMSYQNLKCKWIKLSKWKTRLTECIKQTKIPQYIMTIKNKPCNNKITKTEGKDIEQQTMTTETTRKQ